MEVAEALAMEVAIPVPFTLDIKAEAKEIETIVE